MTNTLYYSLTTPSGAVTGTITATAEETVELDVAIASDASNFLVNFAAVRATTKTLWMKADQNLTIKTNSSGSPADRSRWPRTHPICFSLVRLPPSSLPPPSLLT